MASEYGWAKHDILNDVYLDDLFALSKRINLRKLTEYRMQLAIATNPHIKNPKELWRTFDEQERQMTGQAYMDEDFDVVGFERFKQTLQRHGSAIIVK